MKKHRDSDRSGGDTLEGDGLRKNSSCFSNIKIFLISECALMLAQGTVGAYLVSATRTELVQDRLRCFCELRVSDSERLRHTGGLSLRPPVCLSQTCVFPVCAVGFLLLCTRWTK